MSATAVAGMMVAMKAILALALSSTVLPSLALPIAAQRTPPTPEQLEERYREELASPFVARGNWVTDYDLARQRARDEGRLIFAYFSRSYAF